MNQSMDRLDWISVEQALVVSDCEEFLTCAAAQGFKTQALMPLHVLPCRSLIFSFSREASKHTFAIAEAAPEKQSIFCPLHVFNASIEHAEYALELIMKSDFDAALCAQEVILRRLNGCREFLIEGGESRGNLQLRPEAAPFALLKEDLRNGYVHSIAEFFEVHYAHTKMDEPCPFHFSGEVVVSGILTVLRKPAFDPSGEMRQVLEELSTLVATHKGTLKIEDNQIVSFLCNDLDHSDLLSQAAGKRGLVLSEFAIGVNDTLEPGIDYRMNAQINEGVAGIHVAVGNGSSGFHIDFLSPRTRLTPMAQN